MITLFMIMAHILRDRVPKRCLSVSLWQGCLTPVTRSDTSGHPVRVASRNFLTICLTRFITFSVTFRVTTHVFG
jgi:hypothetical protein